MGLKRKANIFQSTSCKKTIELQSSTLLADLNREEEKDL